MVNYYANTSELPTEATAVGGKWPFLLLGTLVVFGVGGNSVVMLTMLGDRRLRALTANKLIASLAASDLLVGAIVMPFAIYIKVSNDVLPLGENWCRFHLITTVFATTASILHLVAISFDRYFAIVFPMEYQRHSVKTSTSPYLIMIWLTGLAISCTLTLDDSIEYDRHRHLPGDHLTNAIDRPEMCWITAPHFLILSSLLSFVLPGVIVLYLYGKIFYRLRRHRLFVFGTPNRGGNASRKEDAKRMQLVPQVIVEEVKSRRGSRIDTQSPQSSNSRRGSASCQSATTSQRHASIGGISSDSATDKRPRSPTICTENIQHMRDRAAKEPVNSDPPEYIEMTKVINHVTFPPLPQTILLDGIHSDGGVRNASLPVNMVDSKSTGSSVTEVIMEQRAPRALVPFGAKKDSKTMDLKLLFVPNDGAQQGHCSPPLSPATDITSFTLTVPKMAGAARNEEQTSRRPSSNPSTHASSNSSWSSDGSDDVSEADRRRSTYSHGSSITDSSCDTVSRRSSANSNVVNADGSPVNKHRLVSATLSFERKRNRLRRIATQVTKAIRRKRRESIVIRRETKATRVVAAILIAFLLCWLPYFCLAVYRGICLGLHRCGADNQLHVQLYLVCSWFGYVHSCFNPVIYTCLNRTFRSTLTQFLSCRWRNRRRPTTLQPSSPPLSDRRPTSVPV